MIRATHLAAGALVLAVPLGLIGAPAAYAQGDIVAQLRESPQFSMFANLIEAAGLVEELRDVGPYTVFAPTDQAFNRLPQGALDQLRQGQNQGQLEDLIKHHVILGEAYPSDELPERLEPLEGGPLDVGIADSGAVLRPEGGQQVAVTEGDIEAENGIIHAIEGVLIPREVAQALPTIQAQQQTAQAQQQPGPLHRAERAGVAREPVGHDHPRVAGGFRPSAWRKKRLAARLSRLALSRKSIVCPVPSTTTPRSASMRSRSR